MQARHQDPSAYFQESAASCRASYLPYLLEHTPLRPGPDCRVLEVGCGLGGNLSVFAALGCPCTGVELHGPTTEEARRLFAQAGLTGEFLSCDIFAYCPDRTFDLILLHDSFEHIPHKPRLLAHLRSLLSDKGLMYFAFPAWQMPFGGHQQMARSRLLSHFPYIHLLPRPLFRGLFRACGESASTVQAFLDIRDTRVTVESFERLLPAAGLGLLHRTLWLINPHYQAKFGLKPRKLPAFLACLPYLRNFFTTSCFYLVGPAVSVS